MKRGRLGDVVLWKGRLAQVITIAEGRSIGMRYLDNPPCESCGRADPVEDVLEHSPHFQEGVEPVPTVEST